jgi:hypothetical protein
MGQKGRQAIGSGGFVRVGRLSHLLGSFVSLAPRSTVYYHLVSPPTANNDLSLFRSHVISRILSHIGIKEAMQYSCRDFRHHSLSALLAAASQVRGISRPTSEKRKISGARTVRYGIALSSPLGIRQTMGFVKTSGTTSHVPGSVVAPMLCHAAWE